MSVVAVAAPQAFPKPMKTINVGDIKNSAAIKRDDIWLCDLGETKGSEQFGLRPVLILSNNLGNKFSPVVTVVVISSQLQKAKLPTHVELKANLHGLERDSVVLGEQIRSISKERLIKKVSTLDSVTAKKVFKAVVIGMADDELLNEMRNEVV